jgi:amidase
MPIEITLDHVGPMTSTVADNALALEAVAGPDGLDPRQYRSPEANYTQSLNAGAQGLRIAMVKEGFGHSNSEPEVDAKVKAGAEQFRKLGATVDEVSIPMHLLGHTIWLPIAMEGAMEIMMRGNGFGTGWRGLYVTSLLDHHAGWRERADELSETLKITMLFGHYAVKYHRGHYYAKAQNLSRKLRSAYDAVFDDYDLLLMPTLPIKATPLPAPGSPRNIWLQRGFEMIPNTAPFDVTGHPALTLPCGMSDGLPIGLMLVAKHYDEATIYRAAAAFEASGDWKKM